MCEGPKICNDHPSVHADDCQVTRLQECMQSLAGVLLDRALTLDFALEKGFTTSLDDVPADEYNILRVLQAERNKHEPEL